MTVLPEMVSPEPGEQGRVSSDLAGTLAATVGAWDSLLEAVAGADMEAPARKEGRTVRRTLVVLGSWPEGRPLRDIRADALGGALTSDHLDDIEARVITAHGGDTRDAILDSLRRARDEVAEWSTSADIEREALLPVAGPLGIVPLGTLVAATAYQCAVAARDMQTAGVRAGDELLAAGLMSLVDTVGAVAAQQAATLSLAADTPQVQVATGADSGDWRTVMAAPEGTPLLSCDAGVLLDIAAGRASAPVAYARGELKAEDLTGLLAVAQVLSRAPGLPGTDGLRSALNAYESSAAAARAVGSALGGAWRRLRGG